MVMGRRPLRAVKRELISTEGVASVGVITGSDDVSVAILDDDFEQILSGDEGVFPVPASESIGDDAREEAEPSSIPPFVTVGFLKYEPISSVVIFGTGRRDIGGGGVGGSSRGGGDGIRGSATSTAPGSASLRTPLVGRDDFPRYLNASSLEEGSGGDNAEDVSRICFRLSVIMVIMM
jgi:hypothetical protein